MKWKSVVLSLILLCFSMLFAFPVNASPGSYYEMSLTVSAGATRVPTGTPIVTNISVLIASIPGGVDIDWDSVYVIHDGVAIPHQIDDIDGVSGVSGGDEFVFQAAEEIASGSSDSYTVWFAEVADAFPGAPHPVKAWTDYAANYSETDVAAAGGPYAAGVMGPAYFLKNYIITISVPLQAGWRQGSVFNAIIDETGWDVIKQGDYTRRGESGWKWSGFMYESDYGWVNTPTNFTLIKEISEGPVRSILTINSTAPYKGLEGKMPGVHELKTFTIYNGMPAIYSDIALTGSNATLDYDFWYNVKFLDMAFANGTYDTVYGPGVGYKTRYNYTLGTALGGVLYDAELGTTPLTSWWYAMYNATSKRGYGVCFPGKNLTTIDWSTEELDLSYLDIDEPPYVARRLLVLFDPSVTANFTQLMVDMYDTWSAEPTVTAATAVPTTGVPPVMTILIQMITDLQSSVLALQSSIATLQAIIDNMDSTITTLQTTISAQAATIDAMNSTIDTLESTISAQAATIDDLASTVDALNSTLTTTKNDLESKVSTATTYGTIGIIVGIIGIAVGAVALIRKPKT